MDTAWEKKKQFEGRTGSATEAQHKDSADKHAAVLYIQLLFLTV